MIAPKNPSPSYQPSLFCFTVITVWLGEMDIKQILPDIRVFSLVMVRAFREEACHGRAHTELHGQMVTEVSGIG